MASQVGQVYYVRAHNEPNWRIVIKTIPRNFYNFPIVDDSGCDDENDDVELGIPNSIVNDVDDEILPRNDVPPMLVNSIDFESKENGILEQEEEEEDDDVDSGSD